MERGDNLNIEQLLFGDTNRVRHVIRFGTCHRVRDENVAEHSYFTAFYAMMIGRALDISSGEMAELLQRALIHDIEEAESGDFSRPFKYSSKELKAALDVAAWNSMAKILNPVVGVNEVLDLTRMWRRSKEGNTGAILDFADFLSVLGYVAGEIRASNRTMRFHCKDMTRYYERFSGKRFDFLRPWIDQADNILRKEFRE